jgi:Protein of unknown function (DUF416)
MTLEFNEQLLKEELDRLTPAVNLAFAASCAQRLLNICHSFAQVTGRTHIANLVDRSLNHVWSHILSGPDTLQTEELLEDLMDTMPTERDSDRSELTAYAEDGMSSVAYCLRFMLSGDAQEAAWAARRVYEMLDQSVLYRGDIPVYEPGGEARVLADPLIQAELSRQARDLAELKSAGDQMTSAFLDNLRQRSTKEQAITWAAASGLGDAESRA